MGASLEKEKREKENEEFSSAVLYIATAIYIAVCAMIMGGLAATRPMFGDAFLLFFKEYAALLAGIPVLIAVVVAKQQLDANRKQHVATVKYNLRKELDALQIVHNFAGTTLGATQAGAAITASLIGHKGVCLTRPAGSELKLIKELLPYSISSLTTLTSQIIDGVVEYSQDKPYPDDGVEEKIKEAKKYARRLLNEAKAEETRLSQYWS